MVFTTAVNLIRCRGPDKYWKRRKIFRLASHFYGRARNCYSVTIRQVHRALAYATKSRTLIKKDMRDLWSLRLDAACSENNISTRMLREGLDRMGVLINSKCLSDLAIWEPRSFSAVASAAQQKYLAENLRVNMLDKPLLTGKDLDDQPILRSQLTPIEKS